MIVERVTSGYLPDDSFLDHFMEPTITSITGGLFLVAWGWFRAVGQEREAERGCLLGDEIAIGGGFLAAKTVIDVQDYEWEAVGVEQV